MMMLREAGWKVTLRNEKRLHHPDEDFYYMARAKYFVVGVGGFSDIIGRLVRRSHGQVVGRILESKILD